MTAITVALCLGAICLGALFVTTGAPIALLGVGVCAMILVVNDE